MQNGRYNSRKRMLTNICIVVILYYVRIASGDIGEPKCYSKFDYDEKMLLKLLKIEDKVQKFEELINELKANHEKEKVERGKLFDSEIDAFRERTAEEVKKQQNFTEEVLGRLDDAKTKLDDALQEKKSAQKGDIVAFTVTSPSNGAATKSLAFTTVVTNEGESYDTSTGRFTCSINGLYYFSLHIIKKRSSTIDVSGCHIYLNGSSKVKAYIDPQDGSSGADAGSYGVSNSVYLKLKVGDVITVENCSGGAAAAVESWSSFSGYLERPEI
ncbi:complement C1q-like protein 2 [Mercenaria mercenaria]|uniref:complement C1q-like protein 2 n=1 Tax=Mercenaria mercenaria TaxID=6596 RepID=UPI00234E9EEA|nr:complement C1q-like protein 2 [Mercenaria mercenaria]